MTALLRANCSNCCHFQGPPRQLIHMDAATHAQLQQMDPQQRAMFLHNLQKQRQLALQRQMQVSRRYCYDTLHKALSLSTYIKRRRFTHSLI